MTDKCVYCKYHSSVDGLDACAYKAGLTANRRVCDRYTKSWSTYLALNLGFAFFVIVLIGLPIRLILLLLGVI